MKKRDFSHREQAQLDIKLRVKVAVEQKRVYVTRVINYQRFGSQFLAMSRRLRGQELKEYALALVDRYEVQGLDREVLKHVLWTVFTMKVEE